MVIQRSLQIAALLAFAGYPLTAQQADVPIPTLKATVRRVVIDVVVTDRKGKPVPGLTRQDFSVFEDNAPQKVLSFEPFGFNVGMDYTPPKLPPVPPNTFVNLPTLPEKGPLYVLLYDLVNVEKMEDQIYARQQLVKFIQSKPEGTRFAIFMLSDGLHLVQGFTSDKNLLYAAIDPHHGRAHVPRIFLMGRNFGQDPTGTAVGALNALANFLNGLPGRKNVIWLAGGFPLALFPNDKDSLDYVDAVKQTLDLFARSQIAIYPVDVRGVSIENAHAPAGSTGGGGMVSDAREIAGAQSDTPSPGSSRAAGSISPGAGGIGYNLLSSSYMTQDEIARVTGGRAFYSRNDIQAELTQATEDGFSYYTLSYAPSNKDYDSKLHTIRVDLGEKGYSLAYRRAYYAMDPNALPRQAKPSAKDRASSPAAEAAPRRNPGDSLDANMQHGAPMAHALIFGAHIQAVGAPAMGTPEQMAQLSRQEPFFTRRRSNAAVKPLAPIKLQRYTIDYTVMAHQLQSAGDTAPNLELAVAAFDDEGRMLNASVNVATGSDPSTTTQRQQSYRAEQELFAPLNAITIRVAVRDVGTDRIGAMEVPLPLQPEPPVQAQTTAAAGHP